MFGKRLAALRKQKGMSQYDLADQLDLSRGQLSNYELETREPDFETLRKITNYFDITADYLLGFSDNATDYAVPPDKKLPVLGVIRSGILLLADENVTGFMEAPDYIQANYILKVKDDSMVGAGILKDDYVLCSNAEAVIPGQVIVAIKNLNNGYSEEIIRFYLEESKGAILRAANSLYPDMSLNEGYSVVSVITALFRKEMPQIQTCQSSKVPNAAEWSEVIALASQAGLNVKQVKDILTGQIEIAKKLSEP